MLSRFESLIDLLKTFPTEQSCLDHVRAIRWRDGKYCPHCGGTRIYHFNDKRDFQCGKCRAQFSIKVGDDLPRHQVAAAKVVHGDPADYKSSEGHREHKGCQEPGYHAEDGNGLSCAASVTQHAPIHSTRRSKATIAKVGPNLGISSADRFVRLGRTLIVTEAHVAHAAMPTAVPHEMINL
ncbi:MAG: transposase [Xanthobacteraceae bacterium]